MVKIEVMPLVSASLLARRLEAHESAGFMTVGIMPFPGNAQHIMVVLSDMAALAQYQAQAESAPATESVETAEPTAPSEAKIEQAQVAITVEHHPVVPKSNGANGHALPAPEVLPPVNVS